MGGRLALKQCTALGTRISIGESYVYSLELVLMARRLVIFCSAAASLPLSSASPSRRRRRWFCSSSCSGGRSSRCPIPDLLSSALAICVAQ